MANAFDTNVDREAAPLAGQEIDWRAIMTMVQDAKSSAARGDSDSQAALQGLITQLQGMLSTPGEGAMNSPDDMIDQAALMQGVDLPKGKPQKIGGKKKSYSAAEQGDEG